MTQPDVKKDIAKVTSSQFLFFLSTWDKGASMASLMEFVRGSVGASATSVVFGAGELTVATTSGGSHTLSKTELEFFFSAQWNEGADLESFLNFLGRSSRRTIVGIDIAPKPMLVEISQAPIDHLALL